MFDPGRLLVVKVGNLNELTTSKGRTSSSILSWMGFAVFYGVAMIAVVATILGHINIRRSGDLVWWRDEVSL